MYTTYSDCKCYDYWLFKKNFGNLQHNDLFYNVLACQLYFIVISILTDYPTFVNESLFSAYLCIIQTN